MRPAALPGWATCSLCAILAWSAEARADRLVVLGDGAGLARALEAPGREVMGPEEGRAALERLAPTADPGHARALAREGRSAYTAATFTTAVDALRRAIAEGLGLLPLPELAALELDLGLALLASGADREAAREVTFALRLAPDLSVDTTVHGPPVRRFVETRRRDLAGSAVMRRTVASTPGGAALTIDGRAVGTSPVSLELAVGSHLVSAELPGRAPVHQRVEVAGRGTTVTIELPAAPAARTALDALHAGALAEAARGAREALGASVAIAVSRTAQGLRAVRVDGSGDARSFSEATDEALARALRGPAIASDRSGAVRARRSVTAAPSPRERLHLEETSAPRTSRGVPLWLWIGGGAVLAVAAATTVALVASSGERVLVPAVQ